MKHAVIVYKYTDQAEVQTRAFPVEQEFPIVVMIPMEDVPRKHATLRQINVEIRDTIPSSPPRPPAEGGSSGSPPSNVIPIR